jgi:hypothetical protein
MPSKPCFTCGKPFDFQMPHAKYCSTLCKRRGQRGLSLQGATVAREPASRLVEVVQRDLAAAGVLETLLGQIAVELAPALTSPHSSGSAKATLSKEFSRVMDAALGMSTTRTDFLDELKLRRDRKRGGP